MPDPKKKDEPEVVKRAKVAEEYLARTRTAKKAQEKTREWTEPTVLRPVTAYTEKVLQAQQSLAPAPGSNQDLAHKARQDKYVVGPGRRFMDLPTPTGDSVHDTGFTAGKAAVSLAKKLPGPAQQAGLYTDAPTRYIDLDEEDKVMQAADEQKAENERVIKETQGRIDSLRRAQKALDPATKGWSREQWEKWTEEQREK